MKLIIPHRVATDFLTSNSDANKSQTWSIRWSLSQHSWRFW